MSKWTHISDARFWLCAPIALWTVTSQSPSRKSPIEHWSFRAPVRPSLPAVSSSSWTINPVDAFILSALEQKGLRPSAPADRATLIRRVTLDLTGLLPTPEETAAFLADTKPGAYERVVDRLLNSPGYGERWAQHWLDVVRWAESNGYEHDDDRPQAWRYRDWVVKALQLDMPYDRFVREQVAGDIISPADFDSRVATGFLRAGPRHITGGNQDVELNRQEWLTEAVAGVGNAFLGVTIGCARCHDHKYDPITQAEYYRMQAYLAGSDNLEFTLANAEEKKKHEAKVKAHAARLAPLNAEVAKLEQPTRDRLRKEKMEMLPPGCKEALAVPAGNRTAAQKKLVQEANVLLTISWDEALNALDPITREKRTAVRKKIHAIEAEAPEPIVTAASVGETVIPAPSTFILKRGEPHSPTVEVKPGVPAILTQAVSAAEPDPNGRRLALAKWLTDPQNPLTARVIVNRLWAGHFGRGLVSTPNDFGQNGKPPSHPALLDWLATELVRKGWSLKALHRLMVTSATYRQSSEVRVDAAKRDPDNTLLWRANRRRMDAEAVRDSVLQASGRLTVKMGGPSIRVPLEPEVYDTIFTEYEADNLWPVPADPREHTRRSLYLFRKRNVRLPLLAVFDQPDMMSSCGGRNQSVHALQALTLVNSDFMRTESKALKERLFREAPANGAIGDKQRLNRLFALTIGRAPKPAEMASSIRFLKGQPESVWDDLCLSILNLNEFIYVR